MVLCILGLLVIGAIWWNWKPHGRNSDLKTFNIPAIPGKFKTRHTDYGGFFSKWYFMVADLSPDAYTAYSKTIASDADQSLVIGRQVLIVKGENWNPEEVDKLGNRELEFVPTVNSSYLDWWDVDRITSGTLFKKSLPGACNYKIIFDDQRQRVFIEWHYS